MIEWSQQGQNQQAQWRSESSAPAPRRVVTADDTLAADTAYRMACEGTGLLWQGDFQNARMLVQALMRRTDAKTAKAAKAGKPGKPDKAAAKAYVDAKLGASMVPVLLDAVHRSALGRFRTRPAAHRRADLRVATGCTCPAATLAAGHIAS